MRLSEARQLVQVGLPPFRAASRALQGCRCVDDFREVARRRLPRAVFDYIDGGSEMEISLGANEAAWRSWRFAPQTLRDVSAPDLSVQVLGRQLPAPLGLAPTGYTRMFHPVGEPEVARAASRAGLPYALSTVGSTSVEALAATGHGDLWFQLYMLKDRSRARRLVERAAEAGYRVLELSVDTAVSGQRLRDARNGLTIPPSLSLATVADIARHPRYWTAMLASPVLEFANLVQAEGTGAGDAPQRGAAGRQGSTVADIGAAFDPALDWSDLELLRRWWKGPLLLKGPIGPQDAVRAVGAGVDGLHLSNHGGRQLDRTVATAALVRPVREAVGEGVTVVVDSGVRHGSDIAVALALGADMCMVGRPYLYGLAAAGGAGVARVLSLLVDELRRTMQLLGVATTAELRAQAGRLLVPGEGSGAVLPGAGPGALRPGPGHPGIGGPTPVEGASIPVQGAPL